MSITVVRSFAVDPPTDIVCTDGEWTISNDRLRIVVAAYTVGEAMDEYVKAWAALVSERISGEVLAILERYS